MKPSEFILKYPQFTTNVAGVKAVDYAKINVAINESAGSQSQLAKDFEKLQSHSQDTSSQS